MTTCPTCGKGLGPDRTRRSGDPLTPMEQRIFEALKANGPLPLNRLIDMIYRGSGIREPELAGSSVRSMICYMRRKGLKIVHRYGLGYFLA